MNVSVLLKSVVGNDFLDNINHPGINVFLDYRNSLVELKKTNTLYPNEWLDNEIKAVDEILKIIGNE